MPRSDYGKMLKGHDPKAYPRTALKFCDVLNKCHTIRSFRQVGHFGAGTRRCDIILEASVVLNVVLVRFRNSEGVVRYQVIVRSDSSLSACCREIVQRVKEWKPEIVVRWSDYASQQKERDIPILADASRTREDQRVLKKRDNSTCIPSDSIPWTRETALIYGIIADVATSDDKRARLYDDYAEVTNVHSIIKERCDMMYQQITDALAQLAEFGVLIPIEQKRNGIQRLRLVDHVPDFASPQQEITEQHDTVLPPAQEHAAVEQSEHILQDNSAPMDAEITLFKRNLLAQCIAAIRHGASHILKTYLLVQIIRRYKKGDTS